MQTSATRLLETIIREELIILYEQFDNAPKATAADIQKFLGVSVDGQFGDDSSKAAADFFSKTTPISEIIGVFGGRIIKRYNVN